jgi:hypothetical protein
MKHFIFITVFVLVACSQATPTKEIPDFTNNSRNESNTSTMHKVTYKVDGSKFSNIDLTIENASGGTEQTEASIPWEMTFEAESGQFVYVSAQLSSSGDTVTCEITVDGVTLQEARSEGKFSIATCSGSVR